MGGVGGVGGGVVGSLSFVSGPFGQTEKRGRGGCKHWTFFMDVINVWSLMNHLTTRLVKS